MLCKCGCKVELSGRQAEFATEACRSRSRRNAKSVAEYFEYFKGSPTVLRIIEAGPEFEIKWGMCCQCGHKFHQEGFEKVIVCSTCFHRAWLKEDMQEASLEASCTCVPTDREEDCSACKRAGVPCEHKFYFCVEHQYHIESYCASMCA